MVEIEPIANMKYLSVLSKTTGRYFGAVGLIIMAGRRCGRISMAGMDNSFEAVSGIESGAITVVMLLLVTVSVIQEVVTKSFLL